MPFVIKFRRIGRQSRQAPETLAIDIDSLEEANSLVDRLAGSYREHGRESPLQTRWFRGESGLHVIWVQPQ